MTEWGDLALASNEHGDITLVKDGAEGIAFWLRFDETEDEAWYEFSFEEASHIRDWLNDYLPKEDEA